MQNNYTPEQIKELVPEAMQVTHSWWGIGEGVYHSANPLFTLLLDARSKLASIRAVLDQMGLTEHFEAFKEDL